MHPESGHDDEFSSRPPLLSQNVLFAFPLLFLDAYSVAQKSWQVLENCLEIKISSSKTSYLVMKLEFALNDTYSDRVYSSQEQE